MRKHQLIFLSVIMGWFAVLLFMLGFYKNDLDYLRTAKILSAAVGVCIIGIVILSRRKKTE